MTMMMIMLMMWKIMYSFHKLYNPAASGQTRDLCEDPVCRLQLRF